ncbi:MAG: hypothetical protein EOP04_04420 [Proteobacteria bacterium]|nr:MAG: hypothetical protein EOP04_04420 [Pseudomonadota bacterium]
MIRKKIPALQKAPLSHLKDEVSGLSFVRDLGDSYAAVGFATNAQSFNISVRNGTYRDAFSGREVNV